jgi:predicted regulator of Ras-like GTPase activity (Roadblock/LC7/MglB family)
MFKFTEKQLDRINKILQNDLIGSGVSCSILIDSAGNIVASIDDGSRQTDVNSIACLAAGNYGAVQLMANIVGEENFAMLFHKGKKMSMHLKNATSEFLLVNIFNQDLSLGFLRLKVFDVLQKLEKLLPATYGADNYILVDDLPQKRFASI